MKLIRLFIMFGMICSVGCYSQVSSKPFASISSISPDEESSVLNKTIPSPYIPSDHHLQSMFKGPPSAYRPPEIPSRPMSEIGKHPDSLPQIPGAFGNNRGLPDIPVPSAGAFGQMPAGFPKLPDSLGCGIGHGLPELPGMPQPPVVPESFPTPHGLPTGVPNVTLNKPSGIGSPGTAHGNTPIVPDHNIQPPPVSNEQMKAAWDEIQKKVHQAPGRSDNR